MIQQEITKQENEFITREFLGEQKKIRRMWGKKTFTDTELDALFQGETISFLYEGKKGEVTLYGKLGCYERNGYQNFGFVLTGKPKEMETVKFDKITYQFDRNYFGYRFSDEEVEALKRGETITFIAQGKYKPYQVTGKLGEYMVDNKRCFGLVKEKKKPKKRKKRMIPRSYYGHYFSSVEVEELAAGLKLFVDGMYNPKTNSYFKGYLQYNFEEGRLKYLGS